MSARDGWLGAESMGNLALISRVAAHDGAGKLSAYDSLKEKKSEPEEGGESREADKKKGGNSAQGVR